jgi:2-polyprenyl-3-methyl-5-hydroxy-6-metoxy-1,4-benzoquinol methylase
MKKINCNLCGADDYKLLLKSGDRFYKIKEPVFNVVKCNVCGLVYINPEPEPEELAKHYPMEYGPHQNNFELLKYGHFMKFVKNKFNRFEKKAKENDSEKNKQSNEKKTFLDFGCGNGAHLEKMRRMHPNWDLYGLDNSELACKNVAEKGFKVFCGDILNIETAENFFDEVYLGQVIEHVYNPKEVVKKISNIMKKGGNLTMITPNIDSLAARIFGSSWFALEIPRHLFLFSAKTISRLLSENGFEVENITYDKEPKTAIRSLSYIFFGRSVAISPIFWHILWYIMNPISRILSFFGKTSIILVKAKKL